MGGGELQLAIKGQLDVFLTGNPDISYFKYSYKKYTNFSMDSFKLEFESSKLILTTDLLNNNIYKCTILRYGDLLSKLTLYYKLPAVYSSDKYKFRWVENIGNLIIKKARILANGCIIDNLTGEWMVIWNELTMEDKSGYDKMTGNINNIINPSLLNTIIRINNNKFYNLSYPAKTKDDNLPSIDSYDIIVPLEFWFSRNPSLALPLLQLQYTTITLEIEIENSENLYQIYSSDLDLYLSPKYYNDLYSDNININTFIKDINLNAYIEAKYIFLDNNERNSLILNSINTLLVEQLDISNNYNYNNSTSQSSLTIDLNIHKLTKEIIWTIKRDDSYKFNTFTNYTASIPEDNTKDILQYAKILWNKSYERVQDKPSKYFNIMQPYEYHTNIPKQGIYVYSFALYPQKWTPSGTYNGTLVNTSLSLTINGIYNNDEINNKLYNFLNNTNNNYNFGYIINVYTLSYNVFNINSGLGGMMFV